MPEIKITNSLYKKLLNLRVGDEPIEDTITRILDNADKFRESKKTQ